MGQEGYDTRVLPRKFNETNPNPKPNPEEFVSNGYNYSFRGKIMLSAIVLLFFVVILMLCLHVYARWYLRRARRRHRHRLRRRTQLDFNNDSLAPAALSRGLDAAVLATLPVFTFDPKTEENAPECAVCLSEFEPGQTGRVLPTCNHSFHTECIDMWFHSHATCPLCRAPVERAPEPEVVVVMVRELGSGSGSGSVPDENRTVSSSSSSTSVGSRKSGVTIEVPPRDEIFRNELGRDSPSTQSSFRSPMSRMLSFTRILSRERKESVPPSPCGGACSSAAAERDVERGGQEETK